MSPPVLVLFGKGKYIMKTKRVILMLVLAILALSACDLVKESEQPVQPTATSQEPPLDISTTESAITEPLPSTTQTQAQPTLKPTQTPIPPSATPTPFPEDMTHLVTDHTGAITINVPTTWTDQQTLPWLDESGMEVGTIFIASTDIDKFLVLEAEGVAISVSKQYPLGYIELLDVEIPPYLGVCEDTYHTRWEINTATHRGKEAVLNCHGSSYEWLSIMTLVSKADPAAYIVRLVGFDMIPIFGDSFRDMLLQFEVKPTLLP
jgi:hypothetical protein